MPYIQNMNFSGTEVQIEIIEAAENRNSRALTKFQIEDVARDTQYDYDDDRDTMPIEINDHEIILPRAYRKKRTGFGKKKQNKPHRPQNTKSSHVEPQDVISIEDRRNQIKQKLQKGQDIFTPQEEREIHERAELYCMAVNADKNFYVIPATENCFQEMNGCLYDSVMHEKQREHSLPKKRKRRSCLTDSCYLIHYTKNDPYDNSKYLPKGTKFLRPPDKLVEMVIHTIDNSPDVLLQVPQIYAVLQNRYPYFRYMEKSSLTSWRSSIRHALYQKWFRKIPFVTPAINTKGCYWTINHQADTIEWQIPDLKIKKHRSSNHHVPRQDNGKSEIRPEDFDLDPNTHEKVFALLTEEELEELDSCGEGTSDNVQDILDFNDDYDISISDQISPSVLEEDESMLAFGLQRPREKDPILSSTSWSVTPTNENCNGIIQSKQTVLSQEPPHHIYPPFTDQLLKNCLQGLTDRSSSPVPTPTLENLLNFPNENYPVDPRLDQEFINTWESFEDLFNESVNSINSNFPMLSQISQNNSGLKVFETYLSSPLLTGRPLDGKFNKRKFFCKNNENVNDMFGLFDDSINFGVDYCFAQDDTESLDWTEDISYASTGSSGSGKSM